MQLVGYGPAVTLLRKPIGGAASARNMGIDHAHGSIVTFLDADDYWESKKLERQCEVFERYPQVVLVASRFFNQEPGGERVVYQPTDMVPLGRVLTASGPTAFNVAAKVWTSTVAVRRSALGNHRFESGLEPAEDRDLWVRLVTGGSVYFLSEPLATAVLEPGSLSRSGIDTDSTNMLRVVHRYRALLGRKGVRNWEATVYRKWAGVHLTNGRAGAALPYAWRRLLRQPCTPQAWWVITKCAGLAARGLLRTCFKTSRGPVRGGSAVA